MPLESTLPILVFTTDGSDLWSTSMRSKDVVALGWSLEDGLLDAVEPKLSEYACLWVNGRGIDEDRPSF